MDKVLQFFTNAGFSISSICICLCILFAYFLKNRERKLEERNIYFILDLCMIIIMCVTEIIYVLYFLRVGVDGKLAHLMYFAYFATILCIILFSWVFVLSYRISLNDSETGPKRFKRLFFSIVITIDIILAIMIVVMPVNIYQQYGIFTFDSFPVTVILGYSLVSIAIFLFLLYYKNKSLTTKDFYSCIVSLVLICLLLIYRLVKHTDINIESFQFTIFTLGVFFTVENQDVKLLEMSREKQNAAQSATQSQKDFLATISHQIRSPMNTILGLSQLLLKDGNLTKEKVHDDMEKIHEASVSLLSLVSNITDYSYVVSEKEDLVEKEYDIQELLVELNNDILAELSDTNVNFDMNVSSDIPRKLLGDSSKISKVLFNIINSEVSNFDGGKILLDVSGTKKDDESFQFEFLVTSDGKKINNDDLDINTDSIMDLGVRGKISKEGLGLLVAKNLSEVLEAKLDFSNESKDGYRLTVNQKIVDSTLIDNNIKNILSSAKINLDLSNKKILIIDNEEITSKLLKRLLIKYNPAIEECETSKEALEIVKNNKYDLIFLDNTMPSFNGVPLKDQVKDLVGSSSPIVILAGIVTDEEKDKFIKSGFDDCLAKPINYTELTKLLFNVFNMQNQTMDTPDEKVEVQDEVVEELESSLEEGGDSVV